MEGDLVGVARNLPPANGSGIAGSCKRHDLHETAVITRFRIIGVVAEDRIVSLITVLPGISIWSSRGIHDILQHDGCRRVAYKTVITAIRLYVEIVVDDQCAKAVGYDSLIAAFHQRIAASYGTMGRVSLALYFHRYIQFGQFLKGRAIGIDCQGAVVCGNDDVAILQNLQCPLLKGISSVCWGIGVCVIGNRCGSHGILRLPQNITVVAVYPSDVDLSGLGNRLIIGSDGEYSVGDLHGIGPVLELVTLIRMVGIIRIFRW